jgi:hypothetical protein
MAILFKNNAASTLDYMYQAPDKDFVDIYVIDPTVFPTIAPDSNDYFYLTLVGEDTLEIVKVFAQITNVNTGKLAFRSYRAQEGTTAQTWTKGTRVEMRLTAGALQSFFSTIATTEELGVSKLSTYQQAIEGTDNTTNMTPRRTVDAIHQFNTTIVETPVVTGTTSVRSGTTYPYTFTASVMSGFEDPIVAFYYVGNQTGEEAFIRVPVTTPITTNATATGDVSFTGDVGDVIIVTTYAETASGNLSRYGTLNVNIIANNPPDMSTLVHDVPTTASRYATSTVHFSGVTDADGDEVKYRIKNAKNCSFSKTNNIAANEAVTITWKVPAGYPVDAERAAFSGASTFTLEAYDFLGGASSKNFSTTVQYRWANDTKVTVTSGTSPHLTFTFAAPRPGEPSFIWPNVFVYDINYADGTLFKHGWLTKDETSNWTTGRSVTVDVPWNENLKIHTYWADNGEYDLDTLRVTCLQDVEFSTVVTFTAPVWTTEQGQTITKDDTFNVTWTQGTSSPTYTVSGIEVNTSNDPNFGYIKRSSNISGTATSVALNGSIWWIFDNPAATNYARIRNYWTDTSTNKKYYSAWSSPLLQVNGQTASLDAATITSPAANSVLDPSVVIPTTIALGAVTGQTVDKMKISAYSGITADPSSQQPIWTSGEVAYNSSYNIPANTLSWNGVYKLFVDVHGTITGWARDTDGVVIRTIMHKYTGQPNQMYPVQGQTQIPVKSEQTYTWTNAPRVGSNVPSYTRVVIYRKSDNAVVFSKETGIDATTCVIPANTLAHNTEYHCRIDNWFVEGGQLDANDMTKFTSKTTGFVTSYPAVWQAYRSSTTYSVPYTGTYDVVAIGGGGSGGTGHAVFDSSNPPMFVTYTYSGAGGGSGGISRWQGTINAGTKLTCTIGAGGAAQTAISMAGIAGGSTSVTGGPVSVSAGGGGGGGKDGYGGLNAVGGTGGSGNLQNGGAGGKTIYCDPGRAGEGVNCSGGAGYPTSQCQGNSSVGDAPGGGACSAYGGYIAGGGGAGALGSLTEPAEWATPGWTNDSYTHPANAGAGQVGCVFIISTWAL